MGRLFDGLNTIKKREKQGFEEAIFNVFFMFAERWNWTYEEVKSMSIPAFWDYSTKLIEVLKKQNKKNKK
jgi:hypothetical protein